MALLDFLRGGSEQDRFAGAVMKRLRQRGWPHAISYDPERFEITTGAAAGKFYLGNVFRDWLRTPWLDRRGQLDRAIAFIFESDANESWETARDLLRPVIRPRAVFESMWLSAERDWTSDPEQPLQAVGDTLCSMVAVDRESSISMLGEKALREWGRSFEDVHALALENLRAESPCRFERQEGRFYLSNFGDRYDVSRMLLPHLFGQLELRGDPVTIAPVREALVVCGSEDVAALNAMAASADEMFNDATRPISCAPLVLKNGTWEPFEPTDPALSELRALNVKQRVRDYADQARLLEPHFAELGLDRYVAPLDCIADGAEWRTWTSWTQEARPILPRADAVILLDIQGRVLARSWEDVETACGPLLREGKSYPPRYNGLHWPSVDGWARLAELPVPHWLAHLSSTAPSVPAGSA